MMRTALLACLLLLPVALRPAAETPRVRPRNGRNR